MEFTTVLIAVLIVGLLSAMTADIILDMETIWNSLDLDERGSGRIESGLTKADLSWIQMVEDEPLPEVDVIQLLNAKSRIKSKPVQAGAKVRALLDNLGKQLVDYSALTIRQLKAIAKERGLPKYGSMRKAELVTALSS
jgi:hypothetical protein